MPTSVPAACSTHCSPAGSVGQTCATRADGQVSERRPEAEVEPNLSAHTRKISDNVIRLPPCNSRCVHPASFWSSCIEATGHSPMTEFFQTTHAAEALFDRY